MKNCGVFKKMVQAGGPLFPRAYEHSFNQALMKGTLPKPVFCKFLFQDRLYLRDFAFFLKSIGKKMPCEQEQHFFNTLSFNACTTSKNLHDKYLKPVYPDRFFKAEEMAVEKLPVLSTYTCWLGSMVENKPPGTIVSGLLACFYLYSELGQRMKGKTIPHNPYQLWINSYSSPRFLASTDALISRINQWGAEIDETQEKEWVDTFVQAMEYEIAFWDSVYPEEEKIQNQSPPAPIFESSFIMSQ